MERRTFETPGALELDLRIPAGDVEIQTADVTSTALDVDGERDPGDLRIAFENIAGGNRLIVEHRKRASLIGSNLRVRVTAPHGTRVLASGGSTDVLARGTYGALRSRTGSGDLSADHVRGDADVASASGDLHLGVVDGDLTAHTASGDVRIDRVGGRVSVRSASGDVAIGAADGSVHVTGASSDVSIGSLRAGTANLRTMSGDIRVGIAQGTRVWLDLVSTAGSTTSDLQTSDAPEGDQGPELELRASTMSGDIRVTRATHAPADA